MLFRQLMNVKNIRIIFAHFSGEFTEIWFIPCNLLRFLLLAQDKYPPAQHNKSKYS